MPPHPTWWRGREAIIRFMVGTGTPDLRPVVTQADGQPAVARYVRDAVWNAYRPASLEVLGLDGSAASYITAFASPELFAGSACRRSFRVTTRIRRYGGAAACCDSGCSRP